MKTHISEFPKHPLPHVPPPQQAERPQVRPPTVYVYEKQEWEYRIVTKDADEPALSQDELNELGRDGWELCGVVPLAGGVQFYFKRIRT